jgi:hypothetical protein
MKHSLQMKARTECSGYVRRGDDGGELWVSMLTRKGLKEIHRWA